MENAVKDCRALVVTSQDQMLEKLQRSEVRRNYSVLRYGDNDTDKIV
jgi:hypothetical protein